MEETLIKISKAHGEKDWVCITILKGDTHIRLSLTLPDFAETLLSGKLVGAEVIRWENENKTV